MNRYNVNNKIVRNVVEILFLDLRGQVGDLPHISSSVVYSYSPVTEKMIRKLNIERVTNGETAT